MTGTFETWQSPNDGKFYWHLKADNGEVIAQGQGYADKRDRDHAITLVQQSANASVVSLPSAP